MVEEHSNPKQTDSQSRAVSNINLLLAMNEAATLLLAADDMEDIDDILISSLEIIGRAVGADRVHIWRNKQWTKELKIERAYSWASEHGKEVPEIPTDISSPFPGSSEWHSSFRSGKCIGGPVSAMTPEAQEYFSATGVKTVYFLPLLLGDSLWGMVSIDDCERERSFTEEEITILKSVSLMVASAITRHGLIQDLISVNERAAAASKAKNDFLSNMSHEVMTPLNAIVGMAAVGKKSENIDEKNHALYQIEDASAHLLGIISNVLEMTKIETGKLELVPVEYVFQDMIDKALATVSGLAAEKNQSVKVNISRKIPRHVVGDNALLMQVVSNIMSNAVKFTPTYGRIRLDVALEDEADEMLTLRIEVTDNGIGIAKDQQDKLFIAFEQAQGALNHEYGGTGLGLPISKRIVELMNGQINVESIPSSGTKVSLTVQVARSHIAEDTAVHVEKRSTDDAYSDSTVIPGEFDGKWLLIVEDIEINREILIALLKDSKLKIDCAVDGQEALDMVTFNVDKYDVVFMDLQMPNLGGLEATRLIRQIPDRERGRLPIIAMTANVFSDDIKACFDAGMDGHLGKPLDIEKVLEVLRKYLR